MGPHLCCRLQWTHHDGNFCLRCSCNLLVLDIDAVPGRDRPLHGGNVISHVTTALLDHQEGHAPSGASPVVLGIDEPIPVHKHEQGFADMQHVRGAKEVSPVDFPPSPQVLRDHFQGDRFGGRPSHLLSDLGDLGVCIYPAYKAQMHQIQRG